MISGDGPAPGSADFTGLLDVLAPATSIAVLKFFEDADGQDAPVFIPLHQVCGVYPHDVGTEDEGLTLHLPNRSHVTTYHKDTIRRFWENVEIV